MKWLFQLFKRKGLRFKLLLYFITLILLPVATLGIIGNLVSVQTLEDEANNHTTQMIDQVKKNVDFYVQSVKQSIQIISLDPNAIQFINTNPSVSSERRQSTETEVRRLLSSLTSIHPEIAGIIIVNENDMDISNEMFRVSRDPLTSEDWYKKAMEHPGELQLISKPIGRNITTLVSYSPDDVLSVVQAIANPETGAFQGVVLIDFKLATIESVIRGVTLGKSGFIYILDALGEIVYAPENPIVYRVRAVWMRQSDEQSIVKTIRNERYQIIYTLSDFTQWKTVGVFSLNETLKDVTKLQKISYVLGGLTIIVAVVTALFFTRSIVQPIGKLRKLMKRAEAGDLSVQFESANQDEIGQLGRSFNNMIIEIRNLIDLVYEEQKSKREAELKILQAQIKPHFLYNTLDTIQWMAQERKADDVVVMIMALTNLFRIGLSKGRESIPVSEEMEHIQSYLFIQKARYENKLNYEIYVEPEVSQEMVFKLTLQPLVENAIYHGIKARRGEGHIQIKVHKVDDKLCLRVSDNGAGIPSTQLMELQAVLSGRHAGKESLGYGLFNVHERIRLVYGDNYGVRINSTIGEGTQVEVWYPLRRSVVNDVESNHRR
ncbi:cache domain-containing sensor histidine kinase [Paenibacillus sp. Root444D2]|uniref:cache domain-containing sensor histidine kinase n=1 Tax=Paenibacillus sp. Root444D2 TaxID=1736538 RepID=UPI00070C8666|nr:sensor histidine kinase [Paenibacillus sp. Root444D2]KQX62651.1 histidine kinase [Paenibacillus sp. Root444D2]